MSAATEHAVEVTSAAAPEIVIDVYGLTKSFGGRQVVRNLSMQVKRGTIFGFLGPNGSGKTTTIRMLCGLLTPDEGSGTCLGYDIRTETGVMQTRLFRGSENPLGSTHTRMRAFDWDPIRAEH